MNEVTQIHLGRQAFTIAAPAHTVLRKYLDAIEKRAGKEVGKEVELRVAELLTEAGFNSEKVILESDIEIIKRDLGQPADFGDDEEADEEPDESGEARKLYRDTENAWLGGVAGGVAAYLGIQAWVARTVFVILTLFWGSSILIYIVLWLLVPEAKTPSDKLRMRGKPVTVETIKEFVDSKELSSKLSGEKADEWAQRVSENFTRSTSGFGQVMGRIFRAIGTVLGVLWMAIGVAIIMYVVGMGVYALFNDDKLFTGTVLFPVNGGERVLIVLAIFIAVLFSIFCFVATGLALIRRKWPFPGWLTAVMLGIFLASSAVAAPMIVSAVSDVQERYELLAKTETRTLEPFTRLALDTHDSEVRFERSDEYKIEIRTVGTASASAVETSVSDGLLTVTVSPYWDTTSCSVLCIDLDSIEVTIYGPNVNIPIDMREDSSLFIEPGSALWPEPVIDSL